MNHASLFSGIGGPDLAAQKMGWNNIFHCEINPFGRRVLNYYWPESKSYEDITKTDFSIHRGTIDVLTGGFPCQPYSSAGKRLGKEDDRHLWPEMLRAIREIQPTWIVGENVLGLVNWNGGLVFHEVQTDLEAEGYEVQPYVLPAVSVNAPHRRDRVWFVAYNNSKGLQGGKGRPGKRVRDGYFGCNTKGDAADSSRIKEGQEVRERGAEKTFFRVAGYGTQGITPNSSMFQRHSQRKEDKHPGPGRDARSNAYGNAEQGSPSNTNSNQRCEGRVYKAGSEEAERYISPRNARSNERTTWQDFPTQSPVCNGDDGLSSRLDGITFPKWRNESIKAGGNAIVPQVIHQIFKSIEAYEIEDSFYQ